MPARILLLLISLTVFFTGKAIAQNKPNMNEPYAAQWKKADSLLNKGLPQSARTIVDKVYAEAKSKEQSVQMLKAQLYFLRIDAGSQEDADSLNIKRAEEQARSTAFPSNAVWQSIVAQLYWNYYQQNRYKILDRMHTMEAADTGFEQWDATTFFDKVSALYLQSISRAEALKGINIETYDPVLIKGVNTRTLRPTLFDLLAFRAIDFFRNEEKDITRPTYQFVLDDAAAFAPAKEFAQHDFKTADTSSMHYRALALFAEVLHLHAADAISDAFIDADLERVEFVYTHSVHPDKKALYQGALERMEKEYSSNPLSAMASYRLAALAMNNDAATGEGHDDAGNANESDQKADLPAVKKKLESIIAKYPQSEGGIAAKGMLQIITAPSLSIVSEEAILPDAPFKVLVTYKNVTRAYFRVLKMNVDDYRTDGEHNKDAYIKTLIAAIPVQSFSVALPSTGDYMQHRAEVKVGTLPVGMYAVLVSADEAFSKSNNAMIFTVTQSTRLAVVMQNPGSIKRTIGYILDRKDGTPVAAATVSFYTEKWNNTARRYDHIAIPPATTGIDGSFNAKSADYNYRGLMVKHGIDAFYSAEYFSFYRSVRANLITERTFFFTDRSIYRPGQTIYFKGIIVRTEDGGRSNNVQAGVEVDVTFYDANSQRIATQKLKTNEWGSFAGSFIAPAGGLTGLMRIESSNGSAYISVEEYKRPKFRVDWDTLKSDYALNEPVVVTGHALAYAGNNVDGAMVKYRVTRQARFPYWWHAWRWGGGRSPEQEITQGTATTDADGKFTIRFQTLPDRSIDERSLPIFTYTVHADITDLNGETRSGDKSISAGYRSLQIVADIPEQASRKDLDTLRVTTQNLNGDFVAASVNIKVARLAQPETIYRKRYWPVPDQFTMSEVEFRKSFPLDAYKNEDDYRNWKEAEQTFLRSITTTQRGIVALPESAFVRNGWYLITLNAKDKNGQPVEEKKFVQVWDAAAEGKPHAVLLIVPQQQSAEPGSTATVNAVTGMNDIHIIRQVQTMDEQLTTTQHSIKAAPLIWSKSLTEADRGGIALSFITVKDNRVYTAAARIDVPWANKDLDIEWETHRDKLQPGVAETWTMVVRGNKKDEVAAEMAATLYDASLDAFKPHGWGIGSLFASLNADLSWNTEVGFDLANIHQVAYFKMSPQKYFSKQYDKLDVPRGLIIDYETPGVGMVRAMAAPMRSEAKADLQAELTVKKKRSVYNNGKDDDEADGAIDKFSSGIPAKYGEASGGIVKQQPDIPVRKNLQETAFFYPQLHTDADGAVRIQFTIPEALTEWKLLAFAHTKDMRIGYTNGTVKTQKNLMVQPGLPRFLRQGDEVTLSTKIVNLSDAALSGTARLEVIDALTGKPLNLAANRHTEFHSALIANFTAAKGGSTSASWKIDVPVSRYEPVIIRITAKAGSFTDGEENTLPVLTNRMLVTETLPLWMNGTGIKTFRLDKLLHSAESTSQQVNESTLSHHRLTLEYTANPAWYAVQALPYLMEFPYECAEQTFNRYYANALAAHILAKAQRVKEIFRKWEALDTAALQSNLEKNEELKSALLEETPWVLDAQNETAQKHNIALLFNSAKLARSLDASAKKLEEMFLPEGGWPWFGGNTRPDRYITQYIITGIGRLQHLGIENERVKALAEKALSYLDRKMLEDYKALLRSKANMKEQHIGYFEVQYLYMRSFFDLPQTPVSNETGAFEFYRQQARQYWPKFNPYLKGMIALALHRKNGEEPVKAIIQSLNETSIQKEETGMYWMERGRSWWWYEAPIEAQSLLIECFSEAAKDTGSVDKMKRWLLKQKQTQNWGTTKATADACYALLLQGNQWLTSEPQITVQFGDKTIRSQDMKAEAGTGYFKVAYPGAEIKQDMGNITLIVSQPSAPTRQRSDAPTWGAVYWQYFENMDKIMAAATPLVVKKQLFIERNTDRGTVLEPIASPAGEKAGILKIGDKVKARIEIIVDRDMEYVHLKDGRAACFEPVNVLSGYRWQGGLGYYESTRDASANFFFSYLPKGKYVFEYPMFVTNAGDFSAGLATIQCMYAPEFSAHSEGISVQVK